MVMWILCFLLFAHAQMGELGDDSKRFSVAQTVLAHPVTAIFVCFAFGVFLVVCIFYLKRIIENMSEVEVLVKKNSKEQKYLLDNISEKVDLAQ